MKLVANWQQSWKWISMQCTAAITAVSVTWVATPTELKTHALTLAYNWSMVAFGLLGTFGRLVSQQSAQPEDKGPTP